MKKYVYITIYVSLIIQIITGIISIAGLFIPTDEKILKEILSIELVVQLVEAIFYIWITYAVVKLTNITPRRYIDWSITTPMMLLTTIIYMKYKQDKDLKIEDFFKNNKIEIILIFWMNAAMLLFGYLGETGKLNKIVSVIIGFFFFFMNFKIIYENYAKYTSEGTKLFYFLIICWALYGVAAILPINIKNILYNLLDIVSKNFYGLFLCYQIFKARKS